MDQVNGVFELIGGLLVFMSVYRLHKDKVVRGVSVWPVLFFTTWGMWNLVYYPHLGQTWSFWGGVIMSTANLTWLAQIGYYLGKEKT